MGCIRTPPNVIGLHWSCSTGVRDEPWSLNHTMLASGMQRWCDPWHDPTRQLPHGLPWVIPPPLRHQRHGNANEGILRTNGRLQELLRLKADSSIRESHHTVSRLAAVLVSPPGIRPAWVRVVPLCEIQTRVAQHNSKHGPSPAFLERYANWNTDCRVGLIGIAHAVPTSK